MSTGPRSSDQMHSPCRGRGGSPRLALVDSCVAPHGLKCFGITRSRCYRAGFFNDFKGWLRQALLAAYVSAM